MAAPIPKVPVIRLRYVGRCIYCGWRQGTVAASEEAIAPIILPIFRLPAHIEGASSSTLGALINQLSLLVGRSPMTVLREKYGSGMYQVDAGFRVTVFGRFLAKIAQGFAVEVVGLDGIAENYVTPVVLDDSHGTNVFRYVGTAPDVRLGAPGTLYGAQVGYIGKDLVMRVSLFAVYSPPEYLVVVGQLSDVGLEIVRAIPDE